MELTHTITATARVTASLDDQGRCAVKVFASAPYADGRTATAELSVSPAIATAVQAALAAALLEAEPKLGPALAKSIHIAQEAGARAGETL